MHANEIRMEHNSEVVYDGKLLHETSYPGRAERYTEISLSATLTNDIEMIGKVDFYDPKNNIIHELKRSDKAEDAHIWQCKFYIWLLLLNGVSDTHAILEYPRLRQLNEVRLSENDISYLKHIVVEIGALVGAEDCPPRLNKPICKSCSYFDLCYIDEV